ncbi:hypothetical protein ACEUCJ_07535 [Aeromonas rivipollensis]|uniref:hypothetical protein n=1 Tax=Aeromonas rivipollensis TaxID=948519 RepID=UPI0038D0D432
MTIVVDFIRKGNEHHVFNYETILAIESLDIDVSYYLDDNASALSAIKNKDKVKKVIIKKNKFYFWVTSTLLLLKVLFFGNKDKSPVVLLSATPLQYLLCSLISNLLKYKIIIFMHGELGYISAPKGLGQKIGKFFLLKAFKYRSFVKFVAINEYIYGRLLGLEFDASFYSIEHPLQRIDDLYLEGRNRGDGKITIGAFGIQSKEKNSQLIYELAHKMNSSIFEKIKLVTVGVTNGSFDYDKSIYVEHLCRGHLNSSLIPKNEFMNNVNYLDFAIFFNGEGNSYDLIPSGVFSDCISLSLPIIALSNPQVEFFFNKHGEAGILCKDVDDMADAIHSLAELPEEIHKYKNKMAEIKKSYTPKKYALTLGKILYD